jgi:isopropylmalate/homocitrate/citramalate synthase
MNGLNDLKRNKMKQTAVEWLQQELTEVERNLINKTFLQLNNSIAGHRLKDIFEKAKEIEKQQQGYSEEDLKEAFQSGFTNGFNINSVTFEEWFEEFKKK